jgi:hypothetical protein
MDFMLPPGEEGFCGPVIKDYAYIHTGHCAAGHIQPNSDDDITGCAARCRGNPACGYFAYNLRENECAIYEKSGGCPDSGGFPDFTAYEMVRENSAMAFFDHYRSNAICRATEDELYDFGSRNSLEDCARACHMHAGCNYFAYGKAPGQTGRCFWQLDSACLTQVFDEGVSYELYNSAEIGTPAGCDALNNGDIDGMFDEAGWVVVARAPADEWVTEVPPDADFNGSSFIGTRSVVARRVGALVVDEDDEDSDALDAENVDDSVPASTTWTAYPEWSSTKSKDSLPNLTPILRPNDQTS